VLSVEDKVNLKKQTDSGKKKADVYFNLVSWNHSDCKSILWSQIRVHENYFWNYGNWGQFREAVLVKTKAEGNRFLRLNILRFVILLMYPAVSVILMNLIFKKYL
jgi:hypothetical protein